jgi:hypothetical protein
MVFIGLVRFDLDMVCFDHKKIKTTKWINMCLFHIEKYMDGNLKFGFLELICVLI